MWNLKPCEIFSLPDPKVIFWVWGTWRDDLQKFHESWVCRSPANFEYRIYMDQTFYPKFHVDDENKIYFWKHFFSSWIIIGWNLNQSESKKSTDSFIPFILFIPKIYILVYHYYQVFGFRPLKVLKLLKNELNCSSTPLIHFLTWLISSIIIKY